MMHAINMFDRKGALTTKGFDGSGADWLAQYKPYIEDGRTVVASPHKVYGPETNDLTLQLRKRGITKIILAGMSANLCVEAHLRELLEQGFEVAVVKAAVITSYSIHYTKLYETFLAPSHSGRWNKKRGQATYLAGYKSRNPGDGVKPLSDFTSYSCFFSPRRDDGQLRRRGISTVHPHSLSLLRKTSYNFV